ncbi:MAG TPA: adenylate/guanylate cyclase domain-containing protein, partial [Anaerolineales bacterium]
MNPLHTGTLTFLFTDIEDSTRLWGQHPEAMKIALAQHDVNLRQAIESHRGMVIKSTGDGIHAVFETAADGVRAAGDAQRALTGSFPSDSPLRVRVRMGLHTGEAELRDGDYYGQTLNRAARIMSAGFGGQILLSSVSADLVREGLPAGASLQDLGEHHLKGLLHPERIFQVNMPDLLQRFPALRSQRALPNNLPLQLTSFIGREKEIAGIKELLSTKRLVTLTGSGGTGKTRLAQEVGAQVLEAFPNGVWLVELAPLTDPAQIIPSMAQVFGLQPLPFQTLEAMVTDYLREKKALLILDNCEHLIEACARLADGLLHQCAGLKILASSREALGIAGEAAYPTPSLAGSEAERLFVERARAVNPKFDPADTASIAQICTRLDGIPLAIELAAARTKLLSAEQIARRLDDRFHLLVGGSRTALPRQQTLRALIDWSYDLLSDAEKRLLQFASVFAGGWRLEALEAASEDPDALEHLEQLINKSLVVTEDHEGEMRYFMLETIRQYAREKLFDAGEVPQARDRHFSYFVKVSEGLWETFRSDNIMPVVKWMRLEVENLRAAMEWGLDHHAEENLILAANFCVESSLLGMLNEGVERAGLAVERAKALPPVSGEAGIRRQRLIARALFVRGMVGMGVGNMPLSVQSLKEAIAISRATDDKGMLGYSLEMYYTATGFTSAPDREAAALEGFQIFSQEVEDRFGLGMAHMNMARLAAEKGDEANKEKYFGFVQKKMREAPGSYQAGMFHLGMGLDESMRGNYAAARRIFEDGVKIFENYGSLNFQYVMRSEIGHVERRSGNLAQARSIYHKTIKAWQEIG